MSLLVAMCLILFRERRQLHAKFRPTFGCAHHLVGVSQGEDVGQGQSIG